jgi:hypothetical protein
LESSHKVLEAKGRLVWAKMLACGISQRLGSRNHSGLRIDLAAAKYRLAMGRLIPARTYSSGLKQWPEAAAGIAVRRANPAISPDQAGNSR